MAANRWLAGPTFAAQGRHPRRDRRQTKETKNNLETEITHVQGYQKPITNDLELTPQSCEYIAPGKVRVCLTTQSDEVVSYTDITSVFWN